MRKAALVMSAILVLGISVSALADGFVFSGGSVTSEVTSSWSNDAGNEKDGDQKVSFSVEVGARVEGEDEAWSFEASLSNLVEGEAEESLALGPYKLEVKDQLLKVTAWGHEYEHNTRPDTFGWIAPDAAANSADDAEGARKLRVEWSDARVDFDDQSTAWTSYETKLSAATVGVVGATKLYGKGENVNSAGAYAKIPIGAATAQAEVAMSNNGAAESDGAADRTAFGGKISYPVTTKLTASAHAYRRGPNFFQFNNEFKTNDRTEMKLSATYAEGVTSLTGSYVHAQKASNNDKLAGEIFGEISYAPDSGPSGKVALTISTAAKDGSDENNRTKLVLDGTLPVGALTVNGAFITERDEDGNIDPEYKNLADEDVFDDTLKSYDALSADATYKLNDRTTLSGGVVLLAAKNRMDEDENYSKYNIKLSRSVGSATISAEYIDWSYKTQGYTNLGDVHDSKAVLSVSIPF